MELKCSKIILLTFTMNQNLWLLYSPVISSFNFLDFRCNIFIVIKVFKRMAPCKSALAEGRPSLEELKMKW